MNTRHLYSTDGQVVGSYNRATNEVILYPGATVETVAHEIGWHATYKFAEDEAKAGRPTLLDTLRSFAENAPKAVKDAVREQYGDISGDAILDEFGAHLFGQKHGDAFEKAVKTKEGRAWYVKVWDAIKKAAKDILRAFGVDVDKVNVKRLGMLTPEAGVKGA